MRLSRAMGVAIAALTLASCGSSSEGGAIDSWSAHAPITTSVRSGPLEIRLDYEDCTADWCEVHESVRNRTRKAAEFLCSEQTAITGAGRSIDQFFVSLGNGGGGCRWNMEDDRQGAASPWVIPARQTRSFTAVFYGTSGEGIRAVLLPDGTSVDVPLLTGPTTSSR
jgi:hypothetical protein